MSVYKILEKLESIERKIDGKIVDRWITTQDVSQFTGLSISTIRRAILKGHLRCSRNTGKLLFKLSWVNNWIEGR